MNSPYVRHGSGRKLLRPLGANDQIARHKRLLNFMGLAMLLLLGAIAVLLVFYLKRGHANSAGSKVVVHDETDTRTPLQCDVAILGGGLAGLFSAWRLSIKQNTTSVCVFEKENYFGGRIKDVTGLTSDGSPVGVGGLRINEGQDGVLYLARELGMELELEADPSHIINTRGVFAINSTLLRGEAFPLLQPSVTEESIYAMLFAAGARGVTDQYPDMSSYVKGVTSPEMYRFLTDSYRFRADFMDIDAATYLEFLQSEIINTGSRNFYPTGGMSQMAIRLKAQTGPSVRFFLNQTITSITGNQTQSPSSSYTVLTTDYRIKASSLIVTIDPTSLPLISGNVAQAISSQPIFQRIKPIPVVTIGQSWSERWWERSRPGEHVRRVWTTDNCINYIEIPISSYLMNTNTTRSVFADGYCAEYWMELLNKQSMPSVEDEIHRNLQYLFPDVEVPMPLASRMQVWPGAWHFMHPGSPYSLAELEEWALEPLGPGERVFIAGEAYHTRKAWVEGAVRSADSMLDQHYGIGRYFFPRATAPPPTADGRFGTRFPWGSSRPGR